MKYVPSDAWEAFRNKYISDYVLDIAQGLTTTLIPVVRSDQIESFKASNTFREMRIDWYNIVRKHTDELLSDPGQIVVSFLSKEEFDSRYKGDWYNVFR